ncbi:MAG: SMP-30/gluconolactonase/LRE family protein [Myxococcota bacterium]
MVSLLVVAFAGCVPSRGQFVIDGETSGLTGSDPSSPSTPTPDTPTDPTSPTTGTDPTTPDPTTTTTTPPETGDTGVPVDPCTVIPIAPTSVAMVSSVMPSEDFVFDASGLLYNVPDGHDAVFRTEFGLQSAFVAPFEANDVAGIRVLLDGTLAIANEGAGSVDRIDPATGARTVIVGGLNSPNSLAVGPDGRLYVATFGSVVRVDPAGSSEVELLADLPGMDLDGLTFSPDYGTLYVNHDEAGEIATIALAADGSVLSVAMFLQLAVGFSAELDGMATDVCGNLYVTKTNGEVWRVEPDGTAGLYADAPVGDPFTTGVQFGSGVGGWQRDHLYLMDRNNGLVDLGVGVEGRPEPHL